MRESRRLRADIHLLPKLRSLAKNYLVRRYASRHGHPLHHRREMRFIHHLTRDTLITSLPEHRGDAVAPLPTLTGSNRSARGSYFNVAMYACDFAGHDLYHGDRTRWHTPLYATMRRSKERNPTYPVGGLCSLLLSPTTICIVLVISEIPGLRFQINWVCQLSS